MDEPKPFHESLSDVLRDATYGWAGQYTPERVALAVKNWIEQDYILIPKAELPKVVDGKLPGVTQWGGLPADASQRPAFYREEALGKLALSLAAEAEARAIAGRRRTMRDDLAKHLQPGDLEAFAASLIAAGWRR